LVTAGFPGALSLAIFFSVCLIECLVDLCLAQYSGAYLTVDGLKDSRRLSGAITAVIAPDKRPFFL
jgi:hypothetical protein